MFAAGFLGWSICNESIDVLDLLRDMVEFAASECGFKICPLALFIALARQISLALITSTSSNVDCFRMREKEIKKLENFLKKYFKVLVYLEVTINQF